MYQWVSLIERKYDSQSESEEKVLLASGAAEAIPALTAPTTPNRVNEAATAAIEFFIIISSQLQD
ncbi:hypothetical protein ACWDYH_18990 [Nocardia goodfellowii]